MTGGWSGRRVLVTGATGMVGSWLCRRLLDEGADVGALVLDADPQSELYRSGTVDRLRVMNGDLADADAVDRAVVGFEADTVVHLGAQTIVGAARRSPAATFATNVAGTWNLLESCRLHRDLVERVVVASSDKAYGTSPDLPYREGMPLDGIAPYEASKSCADLVSRSYALTYDLPVAIARCGNIFGGGDLNWSRIVPGTLRSLSRDEQPVLRSDGTFVRDYLHVDDVVDAYLTLAEAVTDPALRGEAFNFSDEAPRTVLEIYEATCAAFGAHVEPLVLDEAVGEIRDQYLDATKAREVLGWAPRTGLEDGLARTVGWYRDHFAAVG
ncbi:MAG: GDP-mannose 4,6-dehydratase [Acidimicrobiales bacterium]|nr:GDP-mannose 4,6-dehydratase [Acidimicrobiales bacterium]